MISFTYELIFASTNKIFPDCSWSPLLFLSFLRFFLFNQSLFHNVVIFVPHSDFVVILVARALNLLFGHETNVLLWLLTLNLIYFATLPWWKVALSLVLTQLQLSVCGYWSWVSIISWKSEKEKVYLSSHRGLYFTDWGTEFQKKGKLD